MVRIFLDFSTIENVNTQEQLHLLRSSFNWKYCYEEQEREQKKTSLATSERTSKKLTMYFAALFFFLTFSSLSRRSSTAVSIYGLNCVVKWVMIHSLFFIKSFNDFEGVDEGEGIDEKLAQHDELPRREKKFHWSKNQPIRKSKYEKHHYRGQKSRHVRP